MCANEWDLDGEPKLCGCVQKHPRTVDECAGKIKFDEDALEDLARKIVATTDMPASIKTDLEQRGWLLGIDATFAKRKFASTCRGVDFDAHRNTDELEEGFTVGRKAIANAKATLRQAKRRAVLHELASAEKAIKQAKKWRTKGVQHGHTQEPDSCAAESLKDSNVIHHSAILKARLIHTCTH